MVLQCSEPASVFQLLRALKVYDHNRSLQIIHRMMPECMAGAHTHVLPPLA